LALEQAKKRVSFRWETLLIAAEVKWQWEMLVGHLTFLGMQRKGASVYCIIGGTVAVLCLRWNALFVCGKAWVVLPKSGVDSELFTVKLQVPFLRKVKSCVTPVPVPVPVLELELQVGVGSRSVVLVSRFFLRSLV